MGGYGGSANIRDYLDFDLEIRKDAPIGYSVSVRSPAGEAQEQMSFPFNERQLSWTLAIHAA